MEEIRSTLFSFSPLKAPGPDGFHPIFFQKILHIVGPKIIAFVQQIFNQCEIRPDINITKICLIPKIEHPVGFVVGCKATNDIIITNEVIHTISNKKGKGGFMVAKLDLSKAYDKIFWEFLEHVLIKNGFPPNSIKLIMS